MKKIVAFLAVAFTFQSCMGEKQKSMESGSTEIQKVQKIENVEANLPQKIEGKKNPIDFIPEGYLIHKYEGGISSEGWDEIKGDLNKDGLEDIVLIIKGTDKTKIIRDEYRGELDRNRRGIIVLLNKGDYYQLASKNYDCFSSENEDGGVYFAPELNVAISKGNLDVNYGHGRYGYWNYTFRYQNGDLELIGYDLYSSRGPVPLYEVSINFLTKKKVTRDNLNKDLEGDNYTVKYKETWKSIDIKKRLRLSEIEDFDGINFDL